MWDSEVVLSLLKSACRYSTALCTDLNLWTWEWLRRISQHFLLSGGYSWLSPPDDRIWLAKPFSPTLFWWPRSLLIGAGRISCCGNVVGGVSVCRLLDGRSRAALMQTSHFAVTGKKLNRTTDLHSSWLRKAFSSFTGNWSDPCFTVHSRTAQELTAAWPELCLIYLWHPWQQSSTGVQK